MTKRVGIPIFLVVFAIFATPAVAKTITPADARANIGQTVTIKGAVSDVYVSHGGTTFIDMGGRYPHNKFSAVIFRRDHGKFHDVRSLGRKTVAITGMVQLYRGHAEMILKDPTQLKRE